MPKQRNRVARHSRTYNKAHVMRDRKRTPSVDIANTNQPMVHVRKGTEDEVVPSDFI